jgi:AcrR family transcriptional regulator
VTDVGGAVRTGKRGRPGNDSATVLRRAIALFNQQGYDATSIGDLARDLGLTKSAIYHHIDSKEDLLAAALDEALDGLNRSVQVALDAPAGTSAAVRLRSVVEESVRILVAHQPAVTLLLRVRGNSPVEQAALERRRAIDEQLASLVKEAAAEGAVRDDIPPDTISRLLFGTVNSLVEWYHADGPIEPEALARMVASLTFDGLRTE